MFLVMRIKRKLAGLHVEDTKQTNHFYCCPESCVMFKKSRTFKLCLMKVEKQESYVDEIMHVVQDKTRIYVVPIVRH